VVKDVSFNSKTQSDAARIGGIKIARTKEGYQPKLRSLGGGKNDQAKAAWEHKKN